MGAEQQGLVGQGEQALRHAVPHRTGVDRQRLVRTGQPGQQAAFEDAIARGLSTVAVRAKGYQGAKVNRGIESPERYVLQIFWDTLEDHTVGFRQSPLFTEWRASVGPFVAAPPHVEHFELTVKSA